MPIPHQEVIYSAAGRPNTHTHADVQACTHAHTQALSGESNKAGRTGQPPNKITSLASCLSPIHQIFLPNKSNIPCLKVVRFSFLESHLEPTQGALD